MRMMVMEMCALLAAGVLGAMLLSIWGTRGSAERAVHSRQSIAVELVWALIPCLMIVAAAIPAMIAIVIETRG